MHRDAKCRIYSVVSLMDVRHGSRLDLSPKKGPICASPHFTRTRLDLSSEKGPVCFASLSPTRDWTFLRRKVQSASLHCHPHATGPFFENGPVCFHETVVERTRRVGLFDLLLATWHPQLALGQHWRWHRHRFGMLLMAKLFL